MTRSINKVWVVAGDGIEGFEDIAREKTLRIFGRFVGHKAVDERPGCWGSNDTAEGCVEEVRVVTDGLLEACHAIIGEYIEINAVAVLLTKLIKG